MKKGVTKVTADETIKAILLERGNITAAARLLKVSRVTIFNMAKKMPTIQEAINQAREEMLDAAESKLYEKVLDGSTPELLFFLKTQGHRRGYKERPDTQVNVGVMVKGYAEVGPDDWDTKPDDNSDNS